jgi:hypothetical protein
MTRTSLTRSLVVITIMASIGRASAADGLYVCNGQMIEPSNKAASPLVIHLDLGPAVSLSAGNGGKVKAKIISDNRIQLKFRTKDYVGEFFHYTGDLMLIYKSGHLGRLTCSKS